jgi:HPt (histidine-containing phosphotransfer) domain-containing protein
VLGQHLHRHGSVLDPGAQGRLGLGAGAYQALMDRFAASQSGLLEQLLAAMAAADGTTAQRHAHSLKGAAGSLGAARLAQAAAALEARLKTSAPGACAELMETVRQCFEEVLERIRAGAAAPPAVARDWPEVARQTEALGQALARDDTDARKRIARLEALLAGTALAPALAPLKRHVDAYAFPQALDCFQAFRTAVAASPAAEEP